MTIERYPCFCCDFLTRDQAEPGSDQICPVCYWQDDYVQVKDPDFWGGANENSLNEAKASFDRCGAIEPRFVKYVREPLPEEQPSSGGLQ